MSPYERSCFIYLDEKPFCRISVELWDELQRCGRQRRGYVRIAEPYRLDDRAISRPGSLKQLTTEFMDLTIDLWAHERHLSYFFASFRSKEDAEKFLRWYPNLAIKPPRRRY